MSDPIRFEAHVKDTDVKNLVSLDKNIRIILDTNDIRGAELIHLPADNWVHVTVEIKGKEG